MNYSKICVIIVRLPCFQNIPHDLVPVVGWCICVLYKKIKSFVCDFFLSSKKIQKFFQQQYNGAMTDHQ